ncbi:MAG: hypothetical protein ABSA41_17040 [Terriglobia bacterium]
MAETRISLPKTIGEALRRGWHFDGGDMDFHEERPLDKNRILLTGTAQLRKDEEDPAALQRAMLRGDPLEKHSLDGKPVDAGFSVEYRGVLTCGPIFKSDHQKGWEARANKQQGKDTRFLKGMHIKV